MSSIKASVLGKPALRNFFDSIAFRYDFLNSFLSFHLDDYWRTRSRDILLERGGSRLLDLGIGTGKFLRSFLGQRDWKRLAGLDFSSSMLLEARKVLPQNTRLICGDFHALPFAPESFDLVISAFALRSVREMRRFFEGVFEALSDGGRAGFLCLTRPKNFFAKIFYYPYLKFYLPLVGGLFSGRREAYEFLSDSILTFQDPAETVSMLRIVGFSSVQIHSFTFGAATLIIGQK